MYKKIKRANKLKLAGLALAFIIAVFPLTSCVKGQTAAAVSGASPAAVSSSSTAAASSDTTFSEVQHESGQINYYFPRDGRKVQPELIKIISSARETLDIAIYSFTDEDVASAVIKAKENGVTVRLITDKQQSGGKYQKAVLKKLKKSKIPIKVNSHSGLMHLKVTVADKKIATTGSFNYTKSAEDKNDEVFVVLNSSKAAEDFDSEFERMWNDSKSFDNY